MTSSMIFHDIYLFLKFFNQILLISEDSPLTFKCFYSIDDLLVQPLNSHFQLSDNLVFFMKFQAETLSHLIVFAFIKRLHIIKLVFLSAHFLHAVDQIIIIGFKVLDSFTLTVYIPEQRIDIRCLSLVEISQLLNFGFQLIFQHLSIMMGIFQIICNFILLHNFLPEFFYLFFIIFPQR